MSETTNHLNHSTWECKYHVVFTPKYRRKVLYGRMAICVKSCARYCTGCRARRSAKSWKDT